MYWLDGSSKLPFVPCCSYLLSSSRAKKFALAQDLIENQARIVKSLVKIGDFDHWCHAASELVDLMLDLVRRDEKYLRRDGLSTRDESLCRISNLNSQFVNLVCFSAFELARKCLSPASRPSGRASIINSILTPAVSRDTNPVLRVAPDRGAALAKFSSAQPPPTTRLAATTTASYHDRPPQQPHALPNETTGAEASPNAPRHSPPPSCSVTTTTSHSHEQQPNGCLGPHTRIPQTEEARSKERTERKERNEWRRRGEKEKQGRKPPSKPPTPTAPLTPMRMQAPRPRR